MRFDRGVPRRCAVVAFSFACAALLAQCGSSHAPPKSALPRSTTTSAPLAVTARAPTSCAEIPVSFIRPYIGPIATTKSLTAAPRALTCQFTNSGASKTLIITIAPGNISAFAALKTTSSTAANTITPVSGLGSSAFSITKNRVPAGMAVLSAHGLIISVTANLSLAQDKQLLSELLIEP